MKTVQRLDDRDLRVLVCAPIGRDAELTGEFLRDAAIPHLIRASVDELCATLQDEGAGAVLMTEEALDDAAFPHLASVLDAQPSWSDVPILLFVGSAQSGVAEHRLESVERLRNVTISERPVRLTAVLSAIRAALRSRERQYDVRDLLDALHRARAEAETANRLKDEFLATLSHELRTPLNAILAWTSMLTRGQVDAERLPRVFETLDRNAQSQARLIAEVLDVSRIVTGKLELLMTQVDVCDLVVHAAEAVRPEAASKKITLTIHEAPGCITRGDAGRLQQVVWNLLNNAIKFTPAGGTIDVDVRLDGTHIRIACRDTGVGIAPEFLPHVFDRFRQADQTTTRAYGGLGLGLSIVKRLVELHGGTVDVSSEGLGLGSVFSVRLPRDMSTRSVAVGTAAAAHVTAVSLAGCRILVVDDDASSREVVAAALERSGAIVSTAASVREGWDVLVREAPDLLITDLAMPEEDGYSFIRRVRQVPGRGGEVIALAMSAFADSSSEAAARRAGFSGFLAKPARAETLLESVQGVLSLNRSTERTPHV